MDSEVRERVNHLQAQCDNFQKASNYTECINTMEEMVSIKKAVYGLDHIEFEKATEKLCQFLNLAAMLHLQKENFELCLDYLRKAELVCQGSLEFKSTTYNNLACYYRRIGKLRTALSYLIQALEMELKLEYPATLADTHLNLCAVLSQLDKHQDALQHSMLSVILLQDQLLQVALAKLKHPDSKDVSDQRLAVLTIAYHNMGVQFEHLKRFEQALKIYNKALKISTEHLKGNQQLISNMARVVSSANQQIDNQKHQCQVARKSRVTRVHSDSKRDVYNEIAKESNKHRNLPRLKARDEYPVIEYNPTAVQHLNKSIKLRVVNQTIDKSFSSKRRPKVYKSTSDYTNLYEGKSCSLNQQESYMMTNPLDSSRQD